MSTNILTTFLLLAGGLLYVLGDNALTPDEIQILQDNGYTVTVNENAETITYEHHGLPDHITEAGWGNPNEARMVNHSYTVPLKATVAETKGCAGGLGVIGLAISGGAFYNPYTGFGWDAVEGECAEELDDCRGHPSPDSTYHYHGVPNCLYTGNLMDKFLGVALDGYPIYGPMDSTGKNWTSADLDECHGHYYNGRYMYRATYDFPYMISCYHGNSVKTQGGGNAQGPPPGGQRPMGGGGPLGGGQVPGPAGMEDDKCRNAKYQDWDSRICRVVCKNAGQDLEDCVGDTNSATTNISSAIFAILLACVFNIVM